MKRDIVCHCGNTMQRDLPDTIDLSEEPQFIQQILEGAFMQVTCDSCGKILKPEFPVHFLNIKIADQLLDLDYLPELERSRYFRDKIETSAQRVAIGYPELREKMLVSAQGLDDRALEVLKFLLLENALDHDLSDHSFSDLSIILNAVEEDKLTFYIYGLKETEVAVPRVSLELYHKVVAGLSDRLDTELYAEIVSPPYVSINKFSIEAEDDS
ncbi:MAG: CpXC domain-containing protein [Spirochaetaceae bacterium]|nr:CpXC domain-containing protein [Spirochaetaceae bacterium]MCF7947486.1 CpXC domain-containing protein [Spirochaetia bacterium]MCF7950592.1 CpXC domain-containing protein [Spirochaetaceae bacterium]